MRILIFLSLILRDIHGFDEYTSCDSMGRSSRQLDLPSTCDLSRDNFCFDKGHHYPDKAIRRFLQENLGLMKRMSSDMDGREVVREMRSGFNMWTQAEHYEDEEYSLGLAEEEGRASNFQINMMPPGENIFNGLRYNIKYGSGLTTIQNVKDEAEAKNSLMSQSSTSSTKTTTSQTTMIVTTVQSSSSSSSSSSVSSTSSSTDYYTETTSQPVPSTFTTARKDTSNDYIEPSTVTEQLQTATTVMDTEQETTFDMQSRETPTEPPVTETDEEETVYADPDDYYSDYFNNINLQPVPSPQVDNSEYDQKYEEYEEVPTKETINDVINDIIYEDIEYEAEEIEYLGESVNACEVIDTIEAPYYANNTRNETLALLNLYPFEQYVHMERCTSEGDEMLCRPGCRCEQQYRLHRLLAFDPKNECRGIFSDWFRFPSYCICKCYNSARQLKELASRNPKSQKLGQSSSSRRRGPGEDNMETLRLNNHRLMTVSGMDNMPAVFPYEGLAMITDEQNHQEYENFRNRKDFRLPRRMDTPLETHIEDSNVAENSEDMLIEKIAQEHIDNTVESDQVHYKKNMKKARFLDDTFFYNQPIVDFKLSDGTMGSVEQVPRK